MAEEVVDPIDDKDDKPKEGVTPDPDDDDDDDGADDAKGGQVDRRALQAERGKRKEATKALNALKTQSAEDKRLADEYRALLPHLPAILDAAKKGQATPPKPAGNEPDPELVEIANDFGFVDENGNPDLKRAQRVRDRETKRGQAIAGQATEGTNKQLATVKANQMRDQMYKATDEEGNLYAKKEAIDEMIKDLGPEGIASEEGAMMALIMARGLRGHGGQPDAEPLHVEVPGRRQVGGAPRQLSKVEAGVLAVRGKSEKD